MRLRRARGEPVCGRNAGRRRRRRRDKLSGAWPKTGASTCARGARQAGRGGGGRFRRPPRPIFPAQWHFCSCA
eukprot:922170-Pyramimonas_sp.AAC.1